MNQAHDWTPAGRVPLPPTNSRTRLGAMSVLQALDWAFRREHAQLELPEREAPEERGQGFGMEYVLLQRARLGVSVDTFGPSGWGGSTPHEDAEVIAAIVSHIPDDLGGLHMAIRLSEHARAGLVPDWMPGARLRIVPAGIHTNRHGVRGRSEKIGTGVYHSRGRLIPYEIRVCPISYENDDRKLASARATYTEWWFAVSYIRRTLRVCGMLREVSVTNDMPPMAPWQDRNQGR